MTAETSEGAQELQRRTITNVDELGREVGAVLRLDGLTLDPTSIDIDRRDDETMIINMGPSHPSTHGVLRLMLELDGEFVLRTKPVIGYLHTGMEKTGEELSYIQGATNVTRMDYLSPVINELCYSMAVEKLLDIEIPERATWIRMMMSELNRISSHLVWMATNGMDLGASSMMIYGLRERELILAFFEKTAGLRLNLNYVRPGGVAADLPDGWQDDVLVICDTIYARTFEYDELLTGQPIFRNRMIGVAPLAAEEALALGVTGPLLRSTGVAWDLRRAMPYLAYDQVEFDVIVGTFGDNFDRYAIRLNEIRESIRIVRQCIEKMPSGDYRSQDPKVTPPPRARIGESMEALIHHFKLFTEGFQVPAGRGVPRPSSHRGANSGATSSSDGTAKPYRLHVRAPSFVNLQAVSLLMRGGSMSRHDHGRLDHRPRHGRGRPVSHFRIDIRQRAEEVLALYPRPRSAMLPLLHLAQEQDGYVSDEGIAEVAELTLTTPADVRGTALFYDMFHLEPVGTLRRRDLHEHRLPARRRRRTARARQRGRSAARSGPRRVTDCSRSKRPSASPTVTSRRASR